LDLAHRPQLAPCREPSWVEHRGNAPRVVAEAVRAAEVAAEPTESLLADDNSALFTARVDGQRLVAPGTELDLAVDPRRMHFFDTATGAVLGR